MSELLLHCYIIAICFCSQGIWSHLRNYSGVCWNQISSPCLLLGNL